MPTRAEDYEVLYTIGTGSYGRCQKIRRKSDGKVSAGLFPVSAPAAGVAPLPPKGSEGSGLWVSKAVLRSQPAPPQVCVCSGSLEAWRLCPCFFFLFEICKSALNS